MNEKCQVISVPMKCMCSVHDYNGISLFEWKKNEKILSKKKIVSSFSVLFFLWNSYAKSWTTSKLVCIRYDFLYIIYLWIFFSVWACFLFTKIYSVTDDNTASHFLYVCVKIELVFSKNHVGIHRLTYQNGKKKMDPTTNKHKF